LLANDCLQPGFLFEQETPELEVSDCVHVGL